MSKVVAPGEVAPVVSKQFFAFLKIVSCLLSRQLFLALLSHMDAMNAENA
jgi:hypothetical protein